MESVYSLNQLGLTKARFTYNNRKHRIFEIDLLRGILILGMCLDHFMGDFWFLFPYLFTVPNGMQMPDFFLTMQEVASTFYWFTPWRITLRYIGLMLFLILCGISSNFSHNNILRSFVTIVFGLILTAFFYLFSIVSGQEYTVICATLTCIGLCILTYSLVKIIYVAIYNGIKRKKYLRSALLKEPYLKEADFPPYQKTKSPKSWKWVCLAFVFITFILSLYFKFSPQYTNYNFDPTSETLWRDLFFTFNGHNTYYVSFNWNEEPIGQIVHKIILVIVGGYSYGSDWLGYFPFIFYMFLGGFIGETVYAKRESILRIFFLHRRYDQNGNDKLLILNDELNRYFSPIIGFGKRTIWVYIFHQPVIVLIMSVIFLLVGMRLNLNL